MITHFLGNDEVAAYAGDLAARLVALGDGVPPTWFLLGVSGQTFADVVIDKLPPEVLARLRIVRVNCNRETKEVTFVDAIDEDSKRAPVLLIDSAVHSGQTMLAVCRKLAEMNFPDVITYTLVLKRTASFVPNYFGILIEENDRCLFQLQTIPNNRLCKRPPFGLLRTLVGDDKDKTFPEIGEDAVTTTFSALLYERETRGTQVYVYEHNNQICGVLSFFLKGRTLFIDLVANSKAYRGRGIGAALIRWAETFARSSNCEAVELWSIESRVDWYKGRKFADMERTLDLGDSKYRLMRRKLLYNTSMVGETA